MNREQIERLVERLREASKDQEAHAFYANADMFKEAADALEGLASDALRYRWLRDQLTERPGYNARQTPASIGQATFLIHGAVGPDGIDAAIDAARGTP